MHRGRAAASLAFVVIGLAPARAGTDPPARVQPAVTQGSHPVPVGGAARFNSMADRGYRETELIMSGTASWARSPVPLVRTPPLDAVLADLPMPDANYKVRLLVRSPTDPADSNGIVVVEWLNVSFAVEGDPLWIWTHDELMDAGTTWVGVSVQPIGITGLKVLDPLRYATLEHPGDAYDHDIFSAALALAKDGTLTPGVDVRYVLGSGESQSALMLYQYIDSGAAEAAGHADGFLLDAGGATEFANHEPAVPTLHFLSEESTSVAPAALMRARPTDPRTDSPMYRTWWVPGAPHMDRWALDYFAGRTAAYELNDDVTRWDGAAHGDFGELGGDALPACLAWNNRYPRRLVLAAALDALERWVVTGVAPESSAELMLDITGAPIRDRFGNATGGVRNPVLDVPVASYEGTQCAAAGYTVPFDDGTLRSRYPTHADYVAKFTAAAIRATTAGHLLPAGRDELIARACSAGVRWGETAPACAPGVATTPTATPTSAAGAAGGGGRLPVTGLRTPLHLGAALLVSALAVSWLRRRVARSRCGSTDGPG